MRGFAVLALLTAVGTPAPKLTDVAFVTRQVGFVVGPGRIARTTDGGRVWHDVWRARGARLDWVTFSDRRHVFAGGHDVIVRSSDGGRTWQRSPLSLPKRVQPWWRLEPHFVSPSVAFAVTDPSSWGGSVFLRSTDGGHAWHELRGMQDVYDVDFVSSRRGFALGRRLYATRDGGATWRALPLPQVPYTLAALDFVDAQRGFVAGGVVAMAEHAPAQALFATTDGGRTWRLRYANPHIGFSRLGGDPFARLHFLDAKNGWATTGLCKCCPSGPCVGAIYVTRDAGHSWRRRGVEVQFSAVGRDEAWSVPDCDLGCTYLLHTADGGRTWRRR